MTESTSQVFTALPPDDPLGGNALDGLLSWAESLIFIQQQSTRAQRRVLDKLPLLREQVRQCLDKHHQAGGFAPNRLLQLQRLHQLWLELGQARIASALIDQWADPIIQAINDETARKQAQIELLLADSQSRCSFDRPAGLAKLDQAAHLIRALPADSELANTLLQAAQPITRWHPSVERYWDHWQHCVEHLYHDWRLAQRGLDWKQAQKQACISSPRYDCAWDQAKTCLEKAHIARREQRRLEKEGALGKQERETLEKSIAQNVQAAIAHLEHMRYEENSLFLWNWNDGFSWRWMDLADELLANQLQPEAVPVAMQALNRYWAKVEPQIEAKLAIFIPDTALLKAARQSVHTFRAIHQQQKLYLASTHIQANDPQHMPAIFEYAQKGYYNINGGIDSPHDRLGAHLLVFLEATGQWEQAANMALYAILDCRKGAAQAAYLLAKRALESTSHPHDKPVQLAWHIIMLQACRCPVISDLIAKDGLEPPPQPAHYYLKTARTISPDNVLIDRVQGVYLAQQKQWNEALPLLEGVVNKRPDWASRDVLLALWASRFAALGVEAALKQSHWNHAGAACWSMQVAHHLKYPDYAYWPQPYVSADKWPLTQLEPLIHHYLTLAYRHFDTFWQAWWTTYIERKNDKLDNEESKQALHFCNGTHLIDYSDLCLELAADYFAKGNCLQARSLYQKGIATLYTEHFHIHARGLHECAVALGEKKQADIIQKALDKMN